MNMNITLAITGASGSMFGVSVLKRLCANPGTGRIHLLLSPNGIRCLNIETGLSPEDLIALHPKIRRMDEEDLGADIASGSHLANGMAIVPCSSGTLGRIAAGVSTNLIGRAADVCLKERRPLVLCLRETPLNRIHLENMLRAHDAGAVIMPLMPGFYTKPRNLEELSDTFATRILDQLGLPETDGRRWE